MNAIIWVKFCHDGLHCWPKAPHHRAYLRDPHRHLFHVKVSTIVEHDDRDIEFHDLLEQSRAIFIDLMEGPNPLPIERSCEMLARAVGEQLAIAHGRTFSVDVSEDGECGATVNSLASQ